MHDYVTVQARGGERTNVRRGKKVEQIGIICCKDSREDEYMLLVRYKLCKRDPSTCVKGP